MRRVIISLITYICIAQCVWPQEAPFFSNKQLRYSYFNPGYIPELQYATISLGGRFQWTGLDGMPIDGFLSAKYFFLGAHSQIGVSMLYDHIGYQQVINPKVNYAFCVPIADDSYINFGVSAGLMSKSYDLSKVDYGENLSVTEEGEILDKLEKGNAPDIDAGFEVLIENLEFGASAIHLLKGNDNVSMNRTIFAFANYNFQTSEWWRLTPHYAFYAFLGDEGSKNIYKNQVGLNFYYVGDYDSKPTDLFYVGAAYRIPNEVTFMAGVSIGIFSVFYSYDYIFANLRHDSYGSHEFGLEFKIPQKDRGCFANYGKSRKKYTRYYRM